MNEAHKDFLYALRHHALRDGSVLSTLQVEQKHGIEHLENLELVNVVRMQVTGYLVHLFGQSLCIAVC